MLRGLAMPSQERPVGESPTLADARPRATSETAAKTGSMSIDVEAIYRRYGDLVLGRCRSLLRNEADARDACQEVFLRLHRYRDAFRHEASPSTYLFKITTSTCLNRIRTRRRHPEELTDEPLLIAVEDSMLSTHEIRDLTGRLLEGCDETTATCVVYHYMDGMTHQEVGDILGLSAAAIRKRIAVFRQKLSDNPPPYLADWEP